MIHFSLTFSFLFYQFDYRWSTCRLGIGMMLRYETSTGGTDLLAQFLARIFRVNVGIMIFIIDAIVMCMGGLIQRLFTEMILSLVLTGEINKIGRL